MKASVIKLAISFVAFLNAQCCYASTDCGMGYVKSVLVGKQKDKQNLTLYFQLDTTGMPYPGTTVSGAFNTINGKRFAAIVWNAPSGNQPYIQIADALREAQINRLPVRVWSTKYVSCVGYTEEMRVNICSSESECAYAITE